MSAALRIPVALVAWMLVSSLLPAQQNPLQPILEVVPGDALGLIVSANVETFSRHVDRLAEVMQLPPPHLDQEAITSKAEGIQVDGPAALILVAREGRSVPTQVWLFVASDYDQLVRSLGGEPSDEALVEVTYAGTPMWIARRGDLALMVDRDDRAVLEAILNSDAGPPEELGVWQAWLGEQDMAGVLLSQGVDRAVQAARTGMAALQAAPQQLPEEQRELLGQSAAVHQALVDYVDERVAQLGIGMQSDDQALRLTGRLRFQQPGPAPQERDQLLAVLPDRPFVLAFSGQMSQQWSEGFVNLYGSMMQGGMGGMAELTDDQKQQLASAMRQAMQGVRGMAFLMGVPTAGAGIYARTIAIMKVDRAAQYLQRYRESIEQMSRITQDAGIPFVPDYAISEVQVGDQSALKIEMDFSRQLQAQESQVPAMARDVMRSMIGRQGKTTAYITAVDSSTIVMAYDDPAQLQGAIEGFGSDRAHLADGDEVAATVALLPENRQATMLISLPGLAEMLGQALKEAEKKGVELPHVPPSPPIGVAIVGESQWVTGQVVVPMATLEALGPLVKSTRKQANGSSTQPGAAPDGSE